MLLEKKMPERLGLSFDQASFEFGFAVHASARELFKYDASVLRQAEKVAHIIPDGGHTLTHIKMLAAEANGVPYGSASIEPGDDSAAAPP
ncbi:UNVERIFIED_ORG: hypothetical protein FHR35_004899 [Microbispora rosea subsp. rosea]